MKRCSNCRKKSLINDNCKCEKTFCFTCLPYFVHGCAFDHRQERKKFLTEQLPKIIPDKIVKI